ncbi:jg8351 [Pararge aegeria aegeria]|uniref:Jg8351 protein n=1 Tax=Pararge aegeria aegeria TaxID=348720 RepID=A0A8S4SNB8_9NEOP|nr:jg8351 [Pararge aegeria aegeria]
MGSHGGRRRAPAHAHVAPRERKRKSPFVECLRIAAPDSFAREIVKSHDRARAAAVQWVGALCNACFYPIYQYRYHQQSSTAWLWLEAENVSIGGGPKQLSPNSILQKFSYSV